jgi:hypothetical protein
MHARAFPFDHRAARFYVRDMKKRLLGLMILSSASLFLSAQTVPVSPEAALAARQEQARLAAEEKINTLTVDVQNLQEKNSALESKVASLSEEISKLREDLNRSKTSANEAVHEDLKRLAKNIEEVDKKRAADNELLSDQFTKAMTTIESAVAAASEKTRPHARVEADPPPAAPDKPGYVYTIQSGDYLALIVKSYNTEFKSKGLKTITLDQVKAANPKVKWNQLKTGQKIIIPKPEGAE